MGSDEDSVREKLLPSNILQINQSESESQTQRVSMNSAIIQNEKEGDNNKSEDLEEGDLRLHDLVYDPDNIEEIENLVNEEPKLVSERDNEGRTPLHTLTLAGDEQAVEIAKILLGVIESEENLSLISIDRQEVLNLQDGDSSSALHYAARGRQPELVAALVRWGANAGLKDANGNSALHLVSEGNTEKAVEVAKILLSNDPKRTQINSVNNNEHTPLHMAIGKKAPKMVDFLLQPENKADLTVKNSIGRTALHYACSATGESESACDIVASLLKRCTKAQLNQVDCRGRTILHLAALKRLPKIVKLLMTDERIDVAKTDDKGRSALHYATEDGCYTKGHLCVEALIDREFPKYGDQVQYLFKTEDNIQKNTPFMYASVNCPAATMQKYVDLCPKPQYWLSSIYMTLIYKNSPLALKPLMDKAFSEDQNDTQEGEDGINTDFGLITGYVDPVEIMPQQETKYLKQAQWWSYDAQREILLHPLVQYFVMKKWQKLRLIISFWVLWQLIWLAAYTTVSLSFYTPRADGNHSSPVHLEGESPNSGDDNRSGSGTQALALLGSVVMLVYLVGSVVNECFEMFTIGSAYILSLTNMLQLVQCVLGFIAIYPVFTGWDEPATWMKYTTAIGILLAYTLSMRDIGKLHSEIGLIVEVLKQVLIQIVQVLVCCSPLLIGFTIAFIIIFDEEESLNSSFPGPIVKVLVMMTGEFEYNDTFKDDDGSQKVPANAYIRIIRLIFFLAFLISIPVAYFNLLTGFALDKVMELRERAKVARVAKQLEHIYFIESILLSFRPLRKIFSHASVVSFLRRLNVTSQWFNTETGPQLKFETLIKERIRKSERNFKHATGLRHKLCLPFRFCQPGLPEEVMSQIYSLASPPPSSSS